MNPLQRQMSRFVTSGVSGARGVNIDPNATSFGTLPPLNGSGAGGGNVARIDMQGPLLAFAGDAGGSGNVGAQNRVVKDKGKNAGQGTGNGRAQNDMSIAALNPNGTHPTVPNLPNLLGCVDCWGRQHQLSGGPTPSSATSSVGVA